MKLALPLGRYSVAGGRSGQGRCVIQRRDNPLANQPASIPLQPSRSLRRLRQHCQVGDNCCSSAGTTTRQPQSCQPSRANPSRANPVVPTRSCSLVLPVPVVPAPAAPSPLEQARMTARSVPAQRLRSRANRTVCASPVSRAPDPNSIAEKPGEDTDAWSKISRMWKVLPVCDCRGGRVRPKHLGKQPRTFAVRPTARSRQAARVRHRCRHEPGGALCRSLPKQRDGATCASPGVGGNEPSAVASVTAPSPGPGLIIAIGTRSPSLWHAPEIEPAEGYLAVLRAQLDNSAPPAAGDLAMITVRPVEPVTPQPRSAEPSVTKTLPRRFEPAAVKAPLPRRPCCAPAVAPISSAERNLGKRYQMLTYGFTDRMPVLTVSLMVAALKPTFWMAFAAAAILADAPHHRNQLRRHRLPS